MKTLSAHRQNGPSGEETLRFISSAAARVRDPAYLVAVPLCPDEFAGILGDLLVG